MRPGDALTFTLTARNPTAQTLQGVLIIDVLPPQVDFVGFLTTTVETTYDAGSRTVTGNVGTLGPNQSAQIIIITRVNDKAQPPDSFFNTAVLRSDGHPDETVVKEITTIPGKFPVTGWVGSVSVMGLLALVLAGLFSASRLPAVRSYFRLFLVLGAIVLVLGGLYWLMLPRPQIPPDDLPPATGTAFNVAATATLPARPTTKAPVTTTAPTSTAPAPAVAELRNNNVLTLENAHLLIPLLGVDAPIVPVTVTGDGWNVAPLTSQVGWLQSTGTHPGDDLAPALAAHITLAPDGRAGPFVALAELPVGAEVVLRVGGANGQAATEYVYEVVRHELVDPTDTRKLYVQEGDELLLVTCAGWSRESRAYEQRRVVTLRLTGTR